MQRCPQVERRLEVAQLIWKRHARRQCVSLRRLCKMIYMLLVAIAYLLLSSSKPNEQRAARRTDSHDTCNGMFVFMRTCKTRAQLSQLLGASFL